MKYAWIRDQTRLWPMRVLCRVLDVSPSGYYGWRTRGASPRRQRRAQIAQAAESSYRTSHGIYGYRKVHRDVVEQGRLPCCRETVRRVLAEQALFSRVRRRWVVTTDSRHDRAVAPNRLARDFRAPGPNQKWASDITYIRTGEGWLYLAAVMDLYSRRIVGWSMSERIDADLVCQALRMGLGHRRPDLGLLHHSDQGVQYTADSFVHLLESHRILASMSRRGDCWDNAVVESFFGSLKTEWLAGRPLPTRQVARQELFTYIEIFYNRIRRHASLGYVSPVAYEARSETAKQDQAA